MAFVITETQNSILSLLFASCVMSVRQLHQCWPSFLIYEMGMIVKASIMFNIHQAAC